MENRETKRKVRKKDERQTGTDWQIDRQTESHQKDKRTKGQKDKRTKGQKDKRTKGQKDKRTKGQKGQKGQKG
jgi:hypothetical protein